MGQLWSSLKSKTAAVPPSDAHAADAAIRGTRPLRDATEADHDWLIRHWLPHLHRLPQLLYESQQIAHGPVQYVCRSSFVGVVCARDTLSEATLTTSDPTERYDVRINVEQLKSLAQQQQQHPADAARPASLGESPRAPDLTITLNMQFTDGSSYHVSGSG